MFHYANERKNDKDSSGDGKNDTFAMTCYEDTEEDKNENGDGMRTSKNQRSLKVMKEK